ARRPRWSSIRGLRHRGRRRRPRTRDGLAGACRRCTMTVVVAIDAGTTGVRAFAVDEHGTPRGWAYREFPQYFPRPGWVEHDADEIWAATEATLAGLRARLAAADHVVAAIGVTNQRETAVVWSKSTGKPLHRAIVWQDRRTAER